jgi:ABC-type sugar transport system substrate-binding protein
MSGQILVALQDEAQEYQRLQAGAAKAAATCAGVGVDVVFAENNAVLQIHQLFKVIHAPEGERPAALVIHSVTGEGLERVARNAAKVGLGWILLNRRVPYVPELRAQRPDLPIAAVTPDQAEIGRIHARQMKALANGGLVLYVQGPADTSAAQDRLRATQEELAGAPFQWKVVNGDWTETSGERAVAGWLRLKTAESQRPALLVAQNDAMAKGARRAAIAHSPEWKRVPVIGCDGLPDGGQKLVAAGELAATVLMPASAGAAIDLVTAWLHERRVPPPEVVLAPSPFPADGPRSSR